jgi:hypothetical protein
VGGIEVTLEEAVHQTGGTGGKTEGGLAERLLGVGGPLRELIVGEGIELRALWKVLERLLTSGHNVGGLHPRHVLRVISAEAGERDHAVRNAVLLDQGVHGVER